MRSDRAVLKNWALLLIMLAVMFGWGDLWAAEPGDTTMPVDDTVLSQWMTYIKTHFTRATWDDLMRWVNFFILAALIFKYARTPMRHFFSGKKAEAARAIERMEEKRRLAQEKIREGQEQLRESNERLERIKERVAIEGQKLKSKLIGQAKNEGRIMLEAAQLRIENQIRDAHQIIRAELIEHATEKALTKLPRIMTTQDHHRMIALWMEQAERL